MQPQKPSLGRQLWDGCRRPLAAIVLALLLGSVLIIMCGENPLVAYRALIGGAFGSSLNLQNTLVRSIPVILSGLAVSIAFACGMFNMGVEGQLYLGAFAAAWVGFTFQGLPAPIHVLLALGAAALTGMVWAYLPAIAKIRWDTNEIVTTMMLNYVAQYFTSYLVSFPFKEPGDLPQTPAILPSAQLYQFSAASRLHAGIVLAIVLAIALYFLIRRTALGYEIRMTGLSATVSRCSGIDTERTALKAMLLSGALGGIAGAVEILGVHYRFINNFSPGYGWDGLAVSLLAKGNPLAILPAGVFYGGLQAGANIMEFSTSVPKQLVDALRAIIILFVAADFGALKLKERIKKAPKNPLPVKGGKSCGTTV